MLPLLATGDIAGNTITATPDLGDAGTSPFVFTNYQKTVQLAPQQAEGGATVSCYLVRFDLALSQGRKNGVYPVVIGVSASATDGSPIAQSFTAYVTITDGSDPLATPKPESQPKVIVSGYTLSRDPVTAGEEFTATVTLKNTSQTKSVQNMTVTASCDTPFLVLQSASNTFFIEELKAGRSTSVKIKYKSDLATPAQGYNISLSISYDNADATPLSSSGTVPVAIVQPIRVEMETPQLASQVSAGDTVPLHVQVMNMGRSTVYNVKCTLFAPGLVPSGSAFIGTMEAGTASSGEIDIFVGTKDMDPANAGGGKYGLTQGKLTLTYEDGAGESHTKDISISTTITEPVVAQKTETKKVDPKMAGQWWISILVLVLAAGLLIGMLVFIRRRGKRHEEI